MILRQSGCVPFFGDPIRDQAVSGNFRIVERTYAPHVRFPVHSHNRAFVAVTLSGVYRQTHLGEEQEFRPGYISFTPTAYPHESRYSETGARVLYIEIPGHELHHFSSAGLSGTAHRVLRGGEAYVAAQQLYREFHSPDALSPVILHGLTMRLLAQIVRQDGTRSNLPPKWLDRAEKYICKNYLEPLSIAEIAKAVCVHPVHLAREYKRHYKRTIGERIRELRFEIACQVLLSTPKSLAEIALSAGYSDQSHFSTAFKKHMGVAPSEYRRRHMEANFAQIR